ncbi:MAG TPA: transketolase [Marinilabiliales bacterium]|jgi:transketolase|nr:MAG: transketolase [Bacteroidetes bacterium GWA2_40_14]OFX61932.1 MAG: transketolase [Bacteroidetes bacterium GWC2_40_13]OFX74079.1 MAG: transketolase [Bacteroidetes bacterium GWD2_40_43]OFX93087.1 MAG: transketolase [Bacteroidetes bacterium GWE2_40_63]OFY21457.1 MAG: transketolase [Bacteroidetes bacterium GWF2_40_13]OFZ25119.1 MAG: transketolase [Bacteroidetes bacterium RIFOXYC2_FULL_40_12]HAM98150.1 transketolase [Marinilabiliales bacterium]
MNKQVTEKAANTIRVLSAAMVEKAKSGHPGGAMGGADFINVLYSEFLRYDPQDRTWPFRDRFFLDPGHMSPMLYSQLALTGSFTLDDLKNFRQWGSITPGHPERDITRGIENTSGPLGQGHTMAVGAAIAERFLVARFGEWMAHKTYTFISDGGVQEEISQGAGRIAGHLGLSNLIMFYDSNDIQLSTKTSVVTSEDTAKKYEAWGWHVITINGNDADQIRNALKTAHDEKYKPTLIIGKTTMGKGCVTENGDSFEGQTKTHGQPLSAAGASFSKTIQNLGGNPDNPFMISDEVVELYKTAHAAKTGQVKAHKEKEAAWRKEHPELASKLDFFLSGAAPKIDYAAIVQKEHQATRAASANVLAELADKVDNMIVASADLADSDKTEAYLKKTKAFAKGDFSGKFLQAGVAELTLAAVCNGIAAHGGIFAACGTFFVFSDYMKPAVRMSALMELPVKYIWTHDAFRVGEDGPTHQPVEQEAQIRLMEELHNHSGKPGLLALRPADVHETTVAWKMGMENTHTPTALILSRQNIQDLPVAGTSKYQSALQAEKGAYIVEDSANPDVILVANGSEVATLVAGAELLRNTKQIKVKVVSAISEGLFRQQPVEYQNKVLPKETPTLGLTAGLPSTLRGLVGAKGKVIGLNHFGHSAPYTVLDEKLGYTAENVVNQVVNLLKENK